MIEDNKIQPIPKRYKMKRKINIHIVEIKSKDNILQAEQGKMRYWFQKLIIFNNLLKRNLL